MKRNNKKGFTIVELVIVIAVIAILSAVLIPTFGSIIDQANKSTAQQYARNKYTELYAADLSDGKVDSGDNAYGTDYAYVVTDATSTTSASALVTVNHNGFIVTFDGKTFGTATELPTAPSQD